MRHVFELGQVASMRDEVVSRVTGGGPASLVTPNHVAQRAYRGKPGHICSCLSLRAEVVRQVCELRRLVESLLDEGSEEFGHRHVEVNRAELERSVDLWGEVEGEPLRLRSVGCGRRRHAEKS